MNSRSYCEGCHLLVAPSDPTKFIHKGKVWHTSCFKKKFEPLRVETATNQIPVEFIDRILEEEKELPDSIC